MATLVYKRWLLLSARRLLALTAVQPLFMPQYTEKGAFIRSFLPRMPAAFFLCFAAWRW
jgi:hypothetical protein